MESVNVVIARQVEPLAQNIRTVSFTVLFVLCCVIVWHSMRLQYNNDFAKFTSLKQKLVKFFISSALQVHYTDILNAEIK